MSNVRRRYTNLIAAIAFGTAGISLVIAEPALAQGFGWFGLQTFETPTRMSPDEIYMRLTRAGYQVIGRLQRNDRVFLADVIDRRGHQQRLVIDGFQGGIVQRFQVAGHPPSTAEAPYGLGSPPGLIGNPPAADRPHAEQPARVPAPRKSARQRIEDFSARPAPADTRTREPAPQSGHPVEAANPPSREPAAAAPAGPTERAAMPVAEAASAPHPAAPAPATPPEPAPKHPTAAAPQPTKTDGPGYANGVPINPLD